MSAINTTTTTEQIHDVKNNTSVGSKQTSKA